MNKNRIITLLIVILSIALVTVVISLVMDNTGKLNQGNYRISDVVLASSLEVKDNSDITQDLTNLSDIKLNFTQKNKISMLITKDENISKVYIDNIKVVKGPKVIDLYLSQAGVDAKQKLTDELLNIELFPIDKEGQNYFEISIDNEYFMQDLTIKDNSNNIKFDGTLLSKYGVPYEDIKFEISFDLNILQNNGTINTCKVDLQLPNVKLITEGVYVERMSLEKFNFKIK